LRSRLAAPATTVSPTGADWPVIGRVDELATIIAASRQGTGCLLVGEPGVGKTIVLRELRRRLAAEGRGAPLVLVTAAAQFPLRGFGTARADEAAVLLIDDAHLLDAASAAEVWHRAEAGAPVVATVRAGAPVPDGIDRLWRPTAAPGSSSRRSTRLSFRHCLRPCSAVTSRTG
jgi:hypothetical protein